MTVTSCTLSLGPSLCIVRQYCFIQSGEQELNEPLCSCCSCYSHWTIRIIQGPVYTNTVSFVTVSFCIRLRLPFTRKQCVTVYFWKRYECREKTDCFFGAKNSWLKMVNAALGFDALAVITLFCGVAVNYFTSQRDVELKLRRFKILSCPDPI